MWNRQFKNILANKNLTYRDVFAYTNLKFDGFSSAIRKETMSLSDMILLSDKLDFSLDLLKGDKLSVVEEQNGEYFKKVKYSVSENEKDSYLKEIIRIYEDRIKELNGQIQFLQKQIEQQTFVKDGVQSA